ncbi:MAG: DNA-3-methyladenine glycosylase family protein [Pseudomonadota bacterium]
MAGFEIKGRRLKVALDHLAAADADLAQSLAEIGPLPPRAIAPGFAGLLRIILGQQLSVASARAIWERLEAKLGEPSPRALLRLADRDLAAIGFSRQKMRFARALAEAVKSRRLDLDALAEAEDEAAMAALTAIDGIGPWTAEIYLLFALGRPDVMPAGDLALLVAAQRLKRLPARPRPRELIEMAEPWRPWRSVAARFLWHYYRNAPL